MIWYRGIKKINFISMSRGPIWPNFAGQNLAKSSRAFLITYDEQPDLAKFCPQTARQNLAKSSRDSLKNFGPPERRGSIWPNFTGQSAGKIWPNRAARRTR